MRLKFIFFSTFFLYILSYGQHVKISGFILEENSLKPVSYATCFDTINKIGTISDETGHFNLALPGGDICLNISYTGYLHRKVELHLNSDTLINIYIEPIKLDEITIIANEEPIHIQTLSGKTHIPAKKINNMPSFAGEPDILKSLSYISGVTNGKEGKSDLYVRGGNKDQNLILMDDAIIYHPYHVGGFLSSINTNMVKSIDFYKGGIPARYGGRVSSVLDVQLKEGHKNKWHGKLNLGLISSGFYFEGPLKKEKSSVVFTFRSSYYNLLNNKAIHDFNEADKLPVSLNSAVSADVYNYTFFDINCKVNHNFNNNNKLFFHYYTSYDFQKEGNINSSYYEAYKRKSGFNINSHTISVGHNFYSVSGNLLKTTVSLNHNTGNYYEFDNYLSLDEHYISDINSFNVINDFNIKSQLIFNYKNNHNCRVGIQNNIIFYQPGKVEWMNEDISSSNILDTIYQYKGENNIKEVSFFVEDEIKISNRINVNIGIRAPITITKKKTYYNIEPRISYRQMLNKNVSLKASYTIINQSLHILSNNYYGLEREVWVGSTGNVKPVKSHQVSFGIFGMEKTSGLQIGLESFYKRMSNLIYYKPSLFEETIYDNWENIIVKDGTGEIYGFELTAQKKDKKFYGYFAYNLSWNYRRFQQLNNGEKFPFIYDKRHEANVIIQYDLSKMYSASINFTINSGARITLPVAYISPGIFFPDYKMYNSINNRSLPVYHRLDIMTQKHWKSKKGFIQHFNVNIFNIYARKNPVYIYVLNGKVYKKSFFSIIPTISYGVEF